MRSKNLVIPVLIVFLIYLFAYGLYDSPLSPYNVETDFKVNPEYINGILTASGILFGIWAIIIERKPKEELKKWLYEHLISEGFWFSFLFLVISVLLVSLTATNLYPSIITLFICSLSFFINVFFITFTLYFYKFKEIKSKI